jgi:DNA gyrase subunit B
VHITPGHVGVGLVVVTALSQRMEVETTRDGIRWAMAFERGERTSPLRRLGPTSIEGTTIRFQPDPEIFGARALDVERVRAKLQQLAWLNPMLGVWFQERRLPWRGGIRRWAECLAADRGEVRVRFSTCQTRDGVFVDLALAWTDSADLDVRCFVNANETRSGTHVAGLWRGLAQVARALGAPARPAGTARQVLGRGLVAVVHVGLHGPQFASPTRDHLASPIARTAVASALAQDLPEAARRDPSLRDLLHDRLGLAAVVG